MVLIVNLNTTVDKTYIIDDFKIDRIYRPSQLLSIGGGKGINVARVLNTLNIENKVIGFTGGEKTGTILNTLHKEKINFVPSPIHGNSRTCHLIIDKKNRTETIINEEGPEITKQEISHFFQLFNKVFTPQIKYLVISGSQPPNLSHDFNAKLIRQAKARGVITIVDTSRKPLFHSIKAKPDLIKPNIDEFKMIHNKEKVTLSVIKEKLMHYFRSGIKLPIITLGKQGAIGLDPRTKKTVKVTPPSIAKVSTIGCGDAFTAGLIYSFIKNYPYPDALKFATATASANALKIGAGVLDKRDISRLLKKVKTG